MSWLIEHNLGSSPVRYAHYGYAERCKHALMKARPEIERAEVVPAPPGCDLPEDASNDNAPAIVECTWTFDAVTGRRWLQVNGQRYSYRLADGLVELTKAGGKEDGKSYQVRRGPAGWGCNCPQGRWKGGCKHLIGLSRLGMLKG